MPAQQHLAGQLLQGRQKGPLIPLAHLAEHDAIVRVPLAVLLPEADRDLVIAKQLVGQIGLGVHKGIVDITQGELL